MNNKISIWVIVGILLITLVIALPLPPPPISNGFQLQIPPLPPKTNQIFNGICAYTPSQMTISDLAVYQNYGLSTGEFQLIYKFKVNTPTCVAGFVGNVTYNQLATPTQAIQQDFNNQILGAINTPSPEPSPIATGGAS